MYNDRTDNFVYKRSRDDTRKRSGTRHHTLISRVVPHKMGDGKNGYSSHVHINHVNTETNTCWTDNTIQITAYKLHIRERYIAHNVDEVQYR